MDAPWLDGLNEAQRRAVDHGDGPLLIIAGAGTGKTKTLACRVANLISRGVQPQRILLLTFTRRAAEEMLRRAERMIGDGSGGKVWGGTFHAIANRLLRIHASAIELPNDFTIMDGSDAADLMNLIRSDLGLAKTDRRFPRKATLQAIYSHTVNAQRPMRDVVEKHFPWCREDVEGMAQIFDGYVARKKEQRLLDYDDLLLFWGSLCETPRIGDKLADQFDHVLVDEYQDTNALQADILRGMRRTNHNLTVVGDDAQSIYSFRAATIRNILDFPSQFPGTTVVTLEQNYRSTQPVLAAANAVMAPAKERFTKELWSNRKSQLRPMLVTCMDEAEQTENVCRNILAHLEQGTPLMKQAVLFRTSHHSAMLEVELARRNIPFHKFGGLKFIEAAHIKDMLAFLRILENPYDELSWFRVLQLFEGVGPRTAQRLMDMLRVRGGRPDNGGPDTPLAQLIVSPGEVPALAREAIGELRAALAYCRGHIKLPQSGTNPADLAGVEEPPLATQVERIRKLYEPLFERVYDNATVRVRDLDQLAGIAARYTSRSRFITDLTLDPPRSTSDLAGPPFLEEDWTTLSTIHSAKGCEWDVVHIIHAADGMIPSDMAVGDAEGVEEERRLFYVALTRAKDMLYVYFPLRYYHRRFGLGDAHGLAQVTRFLAPQARALFATDRSRHALEDDSGGTETGLAATQARLRRLWAT
jgi:DNA helicase-2/ATP-dependent DNA helicase PcrA